ncbi:TIGR04255 family protein [Spirosoma montaniterrae]|uniref:TIGR04255 family protein n=1 Tax=Spirosoma montaniterrae TaxID=1178516 RepID=A0A1P9X0A6_9BACT|nr:TIGR04255 family protein [Spirosoma montaniterrae]AQG81015.1 hypothetical protein AWR27_17820 [Spirosoma montaniterrae]
MKLPRKIDDRLKDAIVNIQFVPGVPAETVLGYAHAHLNTLFDTVTADPFPAFSLQANSLMIDQRSVYFLSKDRKVRIDINGQSITFNVNQGYPGWAEYRNVIADCLNALGAGNVIKQFTRLGIRYISQFDDVQIADSINIDLAIRSVPAERRGQIRVEFVHQGFQVIVTLVDRYPTEVRSPLPSAPGFFSLVDIDVIKFYATERPIDQQTLLTDIDTAHHEQKVLFFELLKDSFLQTLNPQY